MRQARPGQQAEAVAAPGGRLAQALANAVVLADSKGDVDQAAKVLRGALGRAEHAATGAAERVEALAYLAELSVRLDDHDRGREIVREIDAVPVADSERAAIALVLEHVQDLRTSL